MPSYEAIDVVIENRVLRATLAAPPFNLIGPELVRDLITLVRHVESPEEDVAVVVFDSANTDFFSAHADMTRMPELTAELAQLEPRATLGQLYRRISALNQVSIAVVTGQVRGAGSEFILACDMRFAGEHAIFGQPEVGVGAVPGAGAAEHMISLMGRGRALEVLLGADDFPAHLAERYGWVNRTLPEAELHPFVTALARRIAAFPPAGIADTKKRVNEMALPGVDALREDARMFLAAVARPEAQARIAALFEQGLQTDGAFEANLGGALAELPTS